MRIKGVTYDTGTPTVDGSVTRPELTAATMERELAAIAGELNCTAVRITGDDVTRLRQAAETATGLGLAVWISPMSPNADEVATLGLITAAAEVAGELHRAGGDVTLVIGCELSVFMAGLVPGADIAARLASLADPMGWPPEYFAAGPPPVRFNALLADAVAAARQHFAGPVGYAAGLWEDIDWTPFDLVAVDAYRDAANATTLRATLESLHRHGKPVVAAEFGCATFTGAADHGSAAWMLVDRSTGTRRPRPGLVRDEAAQARELASLIDLFTAAGLAGAFVFTYVTPAYPAAEDPSDDLDTVGYGLVRSWPDGRTTPKAAFAAVARAYGAPGVPSTA
ncbi:hypothetical protein [Streptomyces sp. CBMA123]|uniref:hypothetical protein n=1 Tax=Streptomyces sp. CBMA123 TaxID=1896313 RepID=UPI001661A98F|nr:hypothetical protein [Streptomyces sp. CBMA123]MBD0688748.1 hypothetical protein [Streptomyces sp. CBMA123]